MSVEGISTMVIIGFMILAGLLIKIISDDTGTGDHSGGVVIPLDYLTRYHNLKPGVYRSTLLRQSGNIHAELGLYLTPESALNAGMPNFKRAKVHELRVVRQTETTLVAYRRFYNLRGTNEGRKLGGIVVEWVRDLTEEERERITFKYTPPPPKSDLVKPTVLRKDLERVLAEEREAWVKDAIRTPPATVEELLERGVRPLEAWRRYRDVPQSELAKVLGVSSKVMDQYENGTRRLKPEQWELLAEKLSVQVSDINPKLDG